MLEVGRMSFSELDTIGEAIGPSILVAAGLHAVFARPITERFVLRTTFDTEGILKPFSYSDYTGHSNSTPSPLSFTWGIGFGGSP
jgi:hypothetical protein